MEFYIDIKLYILCFKQMHCVKRIKCCGWTDEVTFLYHPDSLFPLNSMMVMMMIMLMALDRAEMRRDTRK